MTGKPKHRSKPADPAADSIRRPVAVAVLAAVLGMLVYGNTLENPFVYDDLRTVVDNRSIRDLGDLGAILSFERFRPLVNLTYALDYAWWELRPRGYHLTSIALHGLGVLLFFLLARTVFADRDRVLARQASHRVRDLSAFAAAALWAVHPMMTEAVGYVSGRSEVLCAIFFLGGFLLLRSFLVVGGAWRLSAGMISFVLALASKEVGAMLPLVLAIYDVLFLGQIGWQGRWRRFHLPIGLLIALGGTVRLWRFFTVEKDYLARTVWQHVMSEWEILLRYLGLLLWPSSQSIVHPNQSVSTPWDIRALAAGAVVVALVALGFLARRRFPLFAFGVAWFLLILAPSSTLIPLNELMAEHRVYLASCGFLLAAVGLFGRAWGEAHPRGAMLLLTVLLASLGHATVARNRIWSDPVSLWGDAAKKAPLTWRALFGYGDALRTSGDCAAAIEPYSQAIRFSPKELGTRMNLGICMAQVGRYEEAQEVFTNALEVDPNFIKAYNNLGRLSMITGRAELAESYFEQAMVKDPGNINSRLNLIFLYQQQRRDPARILALCQQVAAVDARAPGIQDCLRDYSP